MKKLEVGDKLYSKEYARWRNDVSYSFATVKRLTNTRAILSDGTQLINEPKKKWNSEEVEYKVYGDNYTGWSIVTPEILVEANKESERKRIERWFSAQKFTDEQKALIYKTLNNQP